jgi:hypothetical protein
METLNLPNHVIKKSDIWYLNTKTGKFIHADHIHAFCERYYKHQESKQNNKFLKNNFKKELKNAKKRWEL